MKLSKKTGQSFLPRACLRCSLNEGMAIAATVSCCPLRTVKFIFG
jgi:hypothetical protein